MKISLWLLIFITILLSLYFLSNRNKAVIVKTISGNKDYVVRNLPDKQDAANLLGSIEENIHKLVQFLESNKNNKLKHKQYIELLTSRVKDVVLSEGADDTKYTTYTVNKGQQIVFCLRSKKTKKLHDMNLLMFVTIHELSHIACPEINHTPLFSEIFIFLLHEAIACKIYTHQDYSAIPAEYCGIILDASPI